MSWETIDPESDPRELFGFGLRLHGHPGPFLALGIRMGLLALRLLGSTGYHGITVVVETGSEPPISCLVDGIQIATGCTAGKGNLEVRPGGRAAAVFSANGRSLQVILRDEWETRIRAAGAADHLAEAVLGAKEEELFTWCLS